MMSQTALPSDPQGCEGWGLGFSSVLGEIIHQAEYMLRKREDPGSTFIKSV